MFDCVINTLLLLPAFLSKTNLRVGSISVTPSIVLKIVIVFDSSKAPVPYCFEVMAPENCEPWFLLIGITLEWIHLN